MIVAQEIAVVEFPPVRMYELVNDVGAYPAGSHSEPTYS